jgi:pimeloyl-ACP methyl ester carboxylesterase
LWAPVAERLAQRFRVFAIDARGHGDSSKPEGDAAYAWPRLAADLGGAADWVLERTGAATIGLGVGHSFGGTLTMAAAAARQGRYARALLIDPVILPRAFADELATPPVGEPPMAERARRRRHRWPSRPEARAFFAEKALFADWTSRAMDLYTAEGLADREEGVELKCPGRVEGAIFAGGGTLDPFAVAACAELPLRILRATRGDFPREVFRDLMTRLPNGELADIDGGHLVVMERPDVVTEALLAFADDA